MNQLKAIISPLAPTCHSFFTLCFVFQSPLRPNVIIKTHAATGQRSAAGNVISAVWDTSSIHSSPGNGQDAMATSPARHSEETDAAAVVRPKQAAVASPVRPHPQPPASNQPQAPTSSAKTVGGSFLKKISDRWVCPAT